MQIYKAPDNFVYYNGVNIARVIYIQDDLPDEWVLVNVNKNSVETLIDDGLTDEFWNNLQQYGNREDYSYAFCNSAYERISPRYPINATNVMYMFMGCSALDDASNILIHIASEKPNMMYTCANCNSMVKAPIFNFINVPIVKTYTSMYTACYKLRQADVYWGDGSADAVTQRNACQNMFFKCWELTDIDFGNEETGSPYKLDLSYSEGLTIDSVRSLLTSLKTIPTGSAGTYEITLATKTVEMITNEYPDILAGFSDKGWIIKQETREKSSLESEE